MYRIKTTLNRTEKKCYACDTVKPLCEFNKNKSITDGHCSECKECKRIKDKVYREKNKELLKERSKQYKRKHKEKDITRFRAKHCLYSNERRISKIQSRLSLKKYKAEMDEIYLKCPEGYEVDHIVPLINSNVCGLHVPWNLQYLPIFENRSKGNKFIPELGIVND